MILQHPPTLRPLAASALPPSWRFVNSYGGTTYNETFLGTDPAGGAVTTLPVDLVPVKLTCGKTSASPTKIGSDGKTAVQDTISSPVFAKTLTYTQGGTTVGTTQYVDAYQRASLWGTVSAHPSYHVYLGTPKVKPLKTLVVPAAKCSVKTVLGTNAILVDITWFDTQAQSLISALAVPSGTIPIFVTTQAYLTQKGGCCIGGYHSFTGSSVYMQFTYIRTVGAFSQDVSALSHEVGETYQDPFVNNPTPPACKGPWEVGDPLEGEANYGGYPYPLGATNFHLQDLVLPPYFGAPTATSVNGWSTFQGTTLGVCQNGS